MDRDRKAFPQTGTPRETLLQQMADRKANDYRWRDGRTFAYVYYAGDEILETVKAAYNLYFSENALNPSAFPSLREMEVELVQQLADLFHAPPGSSGNLTSGGTESILLAVKTARAWAQKRRPDLQRGEVILPASAHPAFHKACYYFGLKAVVVPTRPDFRADPAAMAAAITPRTVLLDATAPSYPQGVIDPIAEIGQLAQSHELLFHVDSCIGGFILPFMEEAGHSIPAFDFAVEGVTSLSADIHKYGYAAKGASVLLYRRAELRKAQFYVYSHWPGGIYASPGIAGTRPGGAIAAAWAAVQYLGREGYVRLCRDTMGAVQRFADNIRSIPELQILGEPQATILAIASDRLDIYEVGDELGLLGWPCDRQQMPPSLHLSITPAHGPLADDFLRDLRRAVSKAKAPSWNKLAKRFQLGALRFFKKVLPAPRFEALQKWAAQHSPVGGKRSAAMYGMMGELREDGNVEEMVGDFLDRMLS